MTLAALRCDHRFRGTKSSILDRQQRGEDDPLMALAQRAKRDREVEVRIHNAHIPAGGAGLTLEDIVAEGQANVRALAELRQYVTEEAPRHLIITGAAAVGGSVRLAGALTRELAAAGFHSRYVNPIQLRTTPGWRLAEDRVPAELAQPDAVLVDLMSAAVSGGGAPLLTLIQAREKAAKAVVLVANQARGEADGLEILYLTKLGAQVIEFRAAERVLQKRDALGRWK